LAQSTGVAAAAAVSPDATGAAFPVASKDGVASRTIATEATLAPDGGLLVSGVAALELSEPGPVPSEAEPGGAVSRTSPASAGRSRGQRGRRSVSRRARRVAAGWLGRAEHWLRSSEPEADRS
jgi:hypothetical protein